MSSWLVVLCVQKLSKSLEELLSRVSKNQKAMTHRLAFPVGGKCVCVCVGTFSEP